MLKRRKAMLRTIENCKFYDKEEMYENLINETGVLRGIIYSGYTPMTKTERKEVYRFIRMINEAILQSEFKDKIKKSNS